MDVQRAKHRALPAAEAVERHRHRDRHVHPDHPRLHVVDEFTRGVAVAGENGAAVAKLVAVDQLKGAVIVRRAHNPQHRAKDLFAPDGHLRGDVIEKGAADIVARVVTRHAQFAAIDHQFCPFAFAFINIAEHFFWWVSDTTGPISFSS